MFGTRLLIKGKETLEARIRQYRQQPQHWWKEAKPVAAAGAMMVGGWEVFEGLEALFDKVAPVAGTVAGSYGAWLFDHLTTIVQIGLVPYLGYRTYDVFKKPFHKRKVRKVVARKCRKTDWTDPRTAWQRIQPFAYAGCLFFGVQETLDLIDMYGNVPLPVSRGFRPGTFLFENWASLLKAALSGYAAYRGLDRFQREVDQIMAEWPLRPRAHERGVDKVRSTLQTITRHKRYRQVQGSVALATLLPLLAASAIANRPVFTTDLWHRAYSRGFHMIDMGPPHNKNAYRQGLGAYLVRHQSVDQYRLQRDISYLRSLGWQITGRDLFFMTRVVAGEAGNYYHHRNYRQSQWTDMEAIAYAIIARYAAAKANACLRRMYIGGKGVTLYNVVMHDLQFSIANSQRRRRRWHSAFHGGQLLRGVKDRGKFLPAYAAVVEALIGAAVSLQDPSGGSVNYKNNAVWYARGKKWDGSPACGFTLKRMETIEAHTHYTLVDHAGNNPVQAYRRALLSTLGPALTTWPSL